MKSPQSPHSSSLWVFALRYSRVLSSSPTSTLKSLGYYTSSTVLLFVGLRVISSGGFLGRGMVIYLARRDGELYIIKDHWVENPSQEAEMMKLIQGTPGVPTLINSWEVEIEPNIVDTTLRYRTESCQGTMKGKRTHVRAVMSPRGRPLTKFRSKCELVACIKDVLLSNPGFVHEISKANVQFSPKGDRTETQGSSPRCQSLQHFNIWGTGWSARYAYRLGICSRDYSPSGVQCWWYGKHGFLHAWNYNTNVELGYYSISFHQTTWANLERA